MKQLGANYAFGNYPGNINLGNQPSYILNRWQKSGDHAAIQRYNTDYTYINQFYDAEGSDRGISDASFIRLKNLALSWQIPAFKSGKGVLQSCRIYMQGQNLITITRYKGMDPEQRLGSNVALPPLRVLTLGFEASF